MNIGKICDYLYDIGFLDIDSIEDFLLLHENITMKNVNKDNNNLALTLTSYLTQKFNSKQSLNKLSENIINSFTNHIVINRYNGIKVLYNILLSKLRWRYTLFFSKINFFIYKKFDKQKNIVKEGKIMKKNKGKNNKDINENNINDNKNKHIIIENERKLNYDYNLYELSKDRNDNINNKNNNENNIKNENNISSEINEENKNKIINQEENIRKDIGNYRYYYRINNDEFYEEEKRHLKKLEESKAKLEKEKEREYLLRCPFFPLVNSYSRKLSKKRNINDKKTIQTAFSYDKNISKKEVFKKIIKEFSPYKNKVKLDYNNLEKKKLKEMQEKIKEEKMKKEKEKEEMLKNIENCKPKFFSKQTMIRLAQPTTIKKIEDEYNNKNYNINTNNSRSPKKKDKKDKKEKKEDSHSPKKKEKTQKLKPKENKRKKEEEKKLEKKEEDKKKEEKKEEDKKEEKKNENQKSVNDNNFGESNISSSSLDMDRVINQCNENLLGQIHQMGGFQSNAINNIINQIV